MKKPFILIALAVATASILLASCFDGHPSVWGTFKYPETEPMLKRFIALKTSRANVATNDLPPEIKTMFNYAQQGKWLALSNSYAELKERINYQDSLGYGVRHWHGYRGAVEDFVSDAAEKIGWHWEPRSPPRLEDAAGYACTEVHGAFEGFVTGEEKYSTAFGRDIIASIPPGSIYLSGSDPGRFIVSAMCRSQIDGDPFFTISQNGLLTPEYLGYLESMYGKALYVPTDVDLEKCRKDFMADIQRYAENHESPPSYEIRAISDSMVKIMFEKNPQRELFVEEGIPVAWMYPQLEPYGLIFKLNRQPEAILPDEIVQRDHEYWTKYTQPMIGGWLKGNTSVAEIAAFIRKIYGHQDFNGFTGDPCFVRNARSQEMFSKLRSAIGGLYGWRAGHAANVADKERMLREADFAFRQAWALNPVSLEVVYRYANILVAQSRWNEAMLVSDTALTLSIMRGLDSTPYAEVTKRIKELQSQNQPPENF